ncbi:hypothetical protein IscW_ISCW017532 [Ixodes scapularis]|uniref:Uncharacterized protein n=1 Tax=Ixodes scapularis TaxID=6945 RepID=B7PB27_IXOSC|nr:hypothetical protein IscW_ISCW017532 [Ixodes scapularis]|eukprot:XP_002407638.1 hypothetical protein IscW_ISCW017532 [Ixodes scapularis]
MLREGQKPSLLAEVAEDVAAQELGVVLSGDKPAPRKIEEEPTKAELVGSVDEMKKIWDEKPQVEEENKLINEPETAAVTDQIVPEVGIKLRDGDTASPPSVKLEAPLSMQGAGVEEPGTVEVAGKQIELEATQKPTDLQTEKVSPGEVGKHLKEGAHVVKEKPEVKELEAFVNEAEITPQVETKAASATVRPAPSGGSELAVEKPVFSQEFEPRAEYELIPEQDGRASTEPSATEVAAAPTSEEVGIEHKVTNDTLMKDAADDQAQLDISVEIGTSSPEATDIKGEREPKVSSLKVPEVVLEEEKRVREILEYETSLSRARGTGTVPRSEELLHVSSPLPDHAEAPELVPPGEKLSFSEGASTPESAGFPLFTAKAPQLPSAASVQPDSEQGKPILDPAEFNKGPMSDWETELQELRESRLHETPYGSKEEPIGEVPGREVISGGEGRKPEGARQFIITTWKEGDKEPPPHTEWPGSAAPSTSYESAASQVDTLIIVYERDVLGLITPDYEIKIKNEREVKRRAPEQEETKESSAASPRTFIRSAESPEPGPEVAPELLFHHVKRKQPSHWSCQKRRNRSRELNQKEKPTHSEEELKKAEGTELLADKTPSKRTFLGAKPTPGEDVVVAKPEPLAEEPELPAEDKVEKDKQPGPLVEEDPDLVEQIADFLLEDARRKSPELQKFGEGEVKKTTEPEVYALQVHEERGFLEDKREEVASIVEGSISPELVEGSRSILPKRFEDAELIPQKVEEMKSLPLSRDEAKRQEPMFDWDIGPSQESLPARPATRTADTQTEMSTDLFRTKDVREASTYAFLSEEAEEGRRAPDDYLPLYLHRVTLNDKPSIAEMIRKLTPCSEEWEESVPMNWKINPAKRLEKWPSPCVQDVRTPTLLLLGGINLSALEEVLTGCLMLRYNLEENEWRRCDMMPLPRYGHRSVYVNGEIFIIGGFDNRDATYGLRMSTSFCFRFSTQTGELLSSVERYSQDEDRWVVLEKGLYCGRMGMGVAAFQNTLWVVGGIVQIAGLQTCSTAYVEIYNPATDQWTYAASYLPSPRTCVSLLNVDDKELYCFGGIFYNCVGPVRKLLTVDDILVYSEKNKAWKQVASLPAPRHNAHVVQYKNQAFIIGGQDAETPDHPVTSVIKTAVPADKFDWLTLKDVPLPISAYVAVVVPPLEEGADPRGMSGQH